MVNREKMEKIGEQENKENIRLKLKYYRKIEKIKKNRKMRKK